MQPIQVSLDPKKILFNKIGIVFLFIFMIACICFTLFVGDKVIANKLVTLISFLAICITVFYVFGVHIRSLSYKGIVLESNEKGIQLNFFYKVFIPWEDLESVKTITIGQGFKSLVFRVQNEAAYQAKTKEGILVKNMKKNMKQYLTPFLIPTELFPMAAEILEDILNQKIADYKALQAANNANV